MTKVRAPCSAELALTRVAGIIGWDKVSEISGQAERTLRRWSDPEEAPAAGDAISFELGCRLDAAYREAGGQGSPFLHCFSARVELASLAALGDRADLAVAAAILAKESGEAVRATIIASLPGSTPGDLRNAARELEESMAAHHDVLKTASSVSASEDKIRAPEVAPPVANGR